MKENQDNQIENEFEEKLNDEIYEIENKKISKEIDLSIYNTKKKEIEKYKLLNEDEELLLCKEEIFNKIKREKEKLEEDIRIKELFKGEDTDSFYYLNKKELKEKYLKIETYNDEDNEDENSIINNRNTKEMEKLFNNAQSEHPRKIVDGQYQKYSFFSWSGFFCCNKKDYISLGQTYVTYFNTIKLFILLFVLLSIVNIYLINFCSQFTSIYDFNDSKILKTTLANTIIKYFKFTYSFHKKNEDFTNINITFNCDDDIIDSIFTIKRFCDASENNLTKLNPSQIMKEFFVKEETSISDFELGSSSFKVDYIDLSRTSRNELSQFCKEKNKCIEDLNLKRLLNEAKSLYENYYNATDIIYYTCIKSKNYNNPQKNLINYRFGTHVQIITLITFILIIIFYYIYKKSISIDKKEFQKNNIFINNYTLVLHKLIINSNDYNEELSDLISFLNKLIKKNKHLFLSLHENYKEIKDLYVFDISISNVNEKKVKTFEEIKSLQNQIKDILKDNDSWKNKIKNKMREISNSAHNIYINLSEQKEKNENEEIVDKENIVEKKEIESEEGYNIEKQIKIGQLKTQINEKLNNITFEIEKLHKENNLKKYADIYITFTNLLIPKFLYSIYNKSKIRRFFYYTFCLSHKLKKYYYKNQWLNFSLAKENPSDIKWENCYIPTIKKCGRRFLSVLLSICFVIVTSILMIFLKWGEEAINSILIIILTQIINLGSGLILHKFTEFEKYTSKSKEIFSDISKYFWLNFLISMTIFFRKDNLYIFSYIEVEKYFILNQVIIMNMVYSIFTSQASPLLFYILNILKRFSDSKYENGKTTKLQDKKEYNELYVGPEFPFEERYSKILLNLCITLYYGTNCPILYFLFVGYLIVTFLVDKYLMINYYRKPPLYGSLLSKKMLQYLFLGVILYFYGLVYHLSNPYIFDNQLLKDIISVKAYTYRYQDIDLRSIYMFMSPFSLLYATIVPYDTIDFSYNYNTRILLIHFVVLFVFFLNPSALIKKIFTPKKESLSLLNVSLKEIGSIYSIEVLKNYYEVKKIQLFNLIIDCDNPNRNKENYSHLINNYMLVIKYIKKSIDNKSENSQNTIDLNSEEIEDEDSPLNDEVMIERKQLQITGDISYNQSFISKYEIYSNFSLMKNI